MTKLVGVFKIFFGLVALAQFQLASAGSPERVSTSGVDCSKLSKNQKCSNPTTLIVSPVSQTPKDQLSFFYAGIPNSLIDLQDSNVSKLVGECFSSPQQQPKAAFLTPIVAFIAPKLVGLFVDEVNKGLEKELEKYSQTHKQTISFSPYKNSVGTNLDMKHSCFRYTRFIEFVTTTEEANDKESKSSIREIEFDFIGQWQVTNNQFIQIRPLRLYMRSPSVPNDATEISLAISAKANSVWRNLNEGKTGEIFQAVILTEKVKKPEDLKEKNVNSSTRNRGWTKGLHHYDISDKYKWEKIEALPILPYSQGETPDTAITKLEINVAEVGEGKRQKTLKLLQKSLKFFEDDLTSTLEEAAKGIFEEETPVVDDTQDFCATFTTPPTETEGVIGHIQWNDSGECPTPQ